LNGDTSPYIAYTTGGILNAGHWYPSSYFVVPETGEKGVGLQSILRGEEGMFWIHSHSQIYKIPSSLRISTLQNANYHIPLPLNGPVFCC
jgi:hypothetical protein